MQQNPEAAEALMDAGMGCVICPIAQMETLEQSHSNKTEVKVIPFHRKSD